MEPIQFNPLLLLLLLIITLLLIYICVSQRITIKLLHERIEQCNSTKTPLASSNLADSTDPFTFDIMLHTQRFIDHAKDYIECIKSATPDPNVPLDMHNIIMYAKHQKVRALRNRLQFTLEGFEKYFLRYGWISSGEKLLKALQQPNSSEEDAKRAEKRIPVILYWVGGGKLSNADYLVKAKQLDEIIAGADKYLEHFVMLGKSRTGSSTSKDSVEVQPKSDEQEIDEQDVFFDAMEVTLGFDRRTTSRISRSESLMRKRSSRSKQSTAINKPKEQNPSIILMPPTQHPGFRSLTPQPVRHLYAPICSTSWCTGTKNSPFKKLREREDGEWVKYQSISHQHEHQKWSHEELRLADYVLHGTPKP